MTVSPTSYQPDVNNGNGVTTAFPVTFPFYDLTVFHIDSSGTETTWVENTHYTVSGGDGSTGTVTVKTTPTDYTPASGEQLRIERSTPQDQPEDFDFDNQVTEDSVQGAVDKLALVMQEIVYENNRRPAFTKADYATLGPVSLPAASASKAIGWNSAGTALVNIDLVNLNGVAITDLPVTASLEDADVFPIYDNSAGANGAISRANLVTDTLGNDLAAIKGLMASADKIPYYTDAGAAALADFTSVARDLLDDTTVAAQRATLAVTSTADLASTDNAKGAALIGVEDSEGNFTGDTVEAALTELSAGSLKEHPDSPHTGTGSGSINFGSIPSGTKRIIVSVANLSLSGSGTIRLRLGYSGGVVSSGYSHGNFTDTFSTADSSGIAMGGDGAGRETHGMYILTHIGSNIWAFMGMYYQEAVKTFGVAGSVALAGELTQVEVNFSAGTKDDGQVKLEYE